MNRKLTIVLAASITAFVLVLTGAIISWTTGSASAAGTSDLAAVYAQREAEYQSRLQEANTALSAAYAQQDASAQTQVDAAAAQTASITSQEALQVAWMVAPNSILLRDPELVLFQGSLAYEIALDRGMVYVDAKGGGLLYDGTAGVQNTSQARSYDHEEHEKYDDD